MKVLMLSDSETAGGAGVAASRLASGLIRAGSEVLRLVAEPDEGSHSWETIQIKAMQLSLGARVGKRVGIQPSPAKAQRYVASRVIKILEEWKPDVINVHNIHGAARRGWSWLLAKTCHDLAPTAWTLHDMWSFTGRCAYSYECRKFETGCDSTCPTPTEYPSLPAASIAQAWDSRSEMFARCPDLVSICPSQWLARDARSGLWSTHDIEVIPYGLDLDIYKPVDMKVARAALDLPLDRPLVLAAAVNWEERRKGGEYLRAALKHWDGPPITLALMGNGPIPEVSSQIRVISLGFVRDERMKVLAYSSADILAHPAPVDNLPNVVLEALACGTPTAAFHIGGLPDMVRPEISGWLAKEVSVQGFLSVLREAVRCINNGVSLRTPCRNLSETEYSEMRQAASYLSLFEKMQSKRCSTRLKQAVLTCQ